MIELFLHLDKGIAQFISLYGNWLYIVLFFIIFGETGFVIMPFLPGDSLIFAVGTFAGANMLNILILIPLLLCAAILGNYLNYWIGQKFGLKIFKRYINKKYIVKTQNFYDKYGGKTLIFARFTPIIRTVAPFMAGVGNMKWSTFSKYTIIGSLLWVGGYLMLGFLFGNIPIVKNNFSVVIILVVLISFIPIIVDYIQNRKVYK